MKGQLTPFTADVIGMVGSGLMIVAYAYSNLAAQINFPAFNLLNLIGSLLLIVSLTVHFNMASMALEIVWALIALLGLTKFLLRRA